MAKKQPTKTAVSGIGPRLRELREKAGLEQRQLAEAAEIPLGTLRNWEQGLRDPGWDGLQRLADALAKAIEIDAVEVVGRFYMPPKLRVPVKALPIGKPRKE